jgi:hypothetical protein
VGPFLANCGHLSTVAWLAVVVFCRDIGGGREIVASVLY